MNQLVLPIDLDYRTIMTDYEASVGEKLIKLDPQHGLLGQEHT